jgi:mannosyltransferase
MNKDRIHNSYQKLQSHPASPYLLVGLITLLAAALRFYKLGEWGFWIDEIYTITRVEAHFGNFWALLQNLPSRLWMPLSFILTRVTLDSLGVTEFTARLTSNLIGIASIPVLFFMTRKHFGVWNAVLLSLLLAVAPWHVYWSQNARFYTSLLLLYTIGGLAFFYAFEYNRPWYIALFYVVLYFAMSERLQGAYLLPVAIVYLGITWLFRSLRPPGFNKRNIILFFTPFAFMLLFELVRLLITGQSTTAHFIDEFSGLQVGDPFRLFLAIMYNISFPVAAFAVVSGVYTITQRNRAGLYLLISAVLPVVTLVALNPLMFTKDRYVFMTLPFWLLLTAIGIRELSARVRGSRVILAAGLLIIFIAHSGSTFLQYYLANNGNRLDWRGAFQIVESQSQPADIVVSFWPEFGPYYLDRQIQPWERVEVDAILASGQRHWFVIDYETVYLNPSVKIWMEEQARLIEVLYLRQPESNFFIRIYLYDPVLEKQ